MTPGQAKVLADHLQSLMSEEDAADVLKWARNPEAVRYLIAQTPYAIPEHPETEDFQCRGCGEEQGRRPHKPNCPVYVAWAALDDPRAAEAIGAAFDRARPVTPLRYEGGEVVGNARATHYSMSEGLRVNVNGVNFPAAEPIEIGAAVTIGRDGMARPFRLASESEQAANQFTHAISARIEEAFRRVMNDHRLTIETGLGRLSRTQEQRGDLSRTEILVDGVPRWRVDARLVGDGLALEDYPLAESEQAARARHPAP